MSKALITLSTLALIVIAAFSALPSVVAGLKSEKNVEATETQKIEATPARQGTSPTIILDESKVRPYQPVAESFQSIEGNLNGLTEQELRKEAEVLNASLAVQTEIANSRRLSEAEQTNLLAGMRRQSAIYKLLAERGIQKLKRNL